MKEKLIKVFLIEDNKADVRLIKEILSEARRSRFILESAPTLSEGLEKIAQNNFELLLLDLNLPDSAGLETFKKARERIPHIPIIVLTGIDDEELALEAMGLGAQDYMVKGHAGVDFLASAILYAIERKKLLGRQKLLAQVLELLNQPKMETDLVKDLLLMIKRFTGIEAIGIRLKQGDDYPYYETNGFSGKFLELENYLCAMDDKGEIIRDAHGNAYLECMCGNIISGRTNPSLPFFTHGGSFFTNSTTELLATTTEQDRLGRTRNRCNTAGYESLALVPISVGNEIIGLLQLNDHRKDMFSHGLIQFFERICASIGIAFSRRQAEDALRESEENFRGLFETSPMSIIVVSLDGKILDANNMAGQISGFSQEELIGSSVANLTGIFGESNREQYMEIFKNLSSGAPNASFEINFLNKKFNETRWVEVFPTFLKRDNKPYALQFIVHDITERKRVEEELLVKDRALESSINAIALSGLDGKLTYVNPAFLKLWGYRDRREVEGRSAIDFWVSPDEAAQVMAALQKTGQWFGEMKAANKDGGAIDLQLTACMILGVDGGPTGMFAAFHDITERKQAEKALRESEEKYRDLFMSAPETILILDLELNLLDANKYFGFPKDKFIGLNVRDLPTITPEDIKIIWEHRDRLLAGEPIKAFERKFDLLGKEIWLDVNPILLQKEGKPFRFQLIIRDITEHRKLEEQLHQAMKMEAIGMLAGGVAHDFNNNLTPIFGICGILKKELEESHPLYQDILDIQESADRCASLVRQLMAFSRKQVLQPVILNLNDIVNDMEKMLKRIIGEDIKLEKSLEKNLGNTKADAGQMEQIIANIVVNARDAMPQGGKLKIETRNADVDEQFAKEHIEFQPGKYCLLEIIDNGPGIGKNTLPHIFEPFFTTKERGKGTGLGLSTVYGIVKQSRGNILVESEPGKGTAFKIYLPLVESESKPAGKPVDEKIKSLGGTETILIVEDEEAVRRVAKRVLKDLGYKILDAASGEEALMICDKHKEKIHLLITDMVMPGMDGKDLAGFVSQKYPGVKIVFISGYTDDALFHHGGMAPDASFIQKPFQVENLAKKIRETLDRKNK